MPLCQTQTPKQQKSFKAFNIVLAISDERYAEFQIETDKDPELQAVMTSIRNGWSDTRAKTPVAASLYWMFRDEMVTTDGLIFKGTRIVVLTRCATTNPQEPSGDLQMPTEGQRDSILA